jgi:hypothetical protein
MSRKNKIKAVMVVWDDAFDGPGGWVYPDKYRPFIVDPITIGWLLNNDDEKYLTLYSSYYYDEDGALICSNPMHIPRGMIKSITPIKTRKIGGR